ncbi:hypothetical protein [Nocardia caishijiensis]|uniref:YbjN domain-containing protein n=1 Tax=Nocardia caishijiensis TaxID=184756 RepID=A0ABQ6YUT3_9NOCA|nr:hypothetical protein [Nocardia caishijiensis]KAF0849221.1 hypothetical protein FNL39_101658 [Nocardia caishijiensis]
MTDIDEAEIVTELVQATGESATLAYPDWTHAVSTNVQTARGVSTALVVAYRGEEGKIVSFFRHGDLSHRVAKYSDRLFVAQGSEWAGMKCSVARSGLFRIEYSYDGDEAIKWANQVISGLSPDELVEILRPSGDL